MHSLHRQDDSISIINFKQPVDIISWAPYNPGNLSGMKAIVNRTLGKDEWVEPDTLTSFLSDEILTQELDPLRTVLLLTSVRQRYLFHAKVSSDSGLIIDGYCTVGLGNSLAPGDQADYDELVSAEKLKQTKPGTINLIMVISEPLTISAKLSLISMITLAKAAALYPLKRLSDKSGNICLGTGTDTIAICSPPCTELELGLQYAGMHTKLGELTALVVNQCITGSLALRSQKI